MRRRFLETLRPECPLCRDQPPGPAAPLRLTCIEQGDDDDVLQGVLVCTNEACQCEYPILDGIPIIVPNVRSYVAENIQHLTRRRDLGPVVESLFGDCCGPGSTFDATRQQLSCYGRQHYADWTADAAAADAADGSGSLVHLLRTGLAAMEPAATAGPLIDVGCAVGRATFELAARSDQLVLGIDMNFPLIQLAARALRGGRGEYPLRRVGVVYDRQAFHVPCPALERVDFWVCDASALPLARASCAVAVCLNVLDSTVSPVAVLQQLQRVLRPGGHMLLSTPYDWSGAATAIEQWIGGHSQRGSWRGDSAALLRRMLTSAAPTAGLAEMEIVLEHERLPWRLRLHDRSSVHYDVHLVVARQ